MIVKKSNKFSAFCMICFVSKNLGFMSKFLVDNQIQKNLLEINIYRLNMQCF